MISCEPTSLFLDLLLDYDLGSRHGTDFLYWLRTQNRNTAVPVVMYSGSASDYQVGECYALGANHFLRKAQSFTRAMAVVRTLHICFSRSLPHFQFLSLLPESQPDPRTTALLAV